MVNGALTPAEVDKLTLWQYTALLDGWNKAHDDGGDVSPPTREEYEEQLAILRSLPQERMIRV